MASSELEDFGLFTICYFSTTKLGSLKHLSTQQGDWVNCNFLQSLVQKQELLRTLSSPLLQCMGKKLSSLHLDSFVPFGKEAVRQIVLGPGQWAEVIEDGLCVAEFSLQLNMCSWPSRKLSGSRIWIRS